MGQPVNLPVKLDASLAHCEFQRNKTHKTPTDTWFRGRWVCCMVSLDVGCYWLEL